MKKKKKINSGFTLIELMVSMTLFSFVITAALGALYTTLRANEKAKIIKLVVNNLNIALEEMSRELRVAHDFKCNGYNGDSPRECSKITFKTKDDCDGMYEFYNHTIYKKIAKKNNNVCESNPPRLSIIGENINIDKLSFITLNLDPNDHTTQPKILIRLKGSTIVDNPLTPKETFNIQTTISQRATK